jgi:hypothetical protein
MKLARTLSVVIVVLSQWTGSMQAQTCGGGGGSGGSGGFGPAPCIAAVIDSEPPNSGITVKVYSDFLVFNTALGVVYRESHCQAFLGPPGEFNAAGSAFDYQTFWAFIPANPPAGSIPPLGLLNIQATTCHNPPTFHVPPPRFPPFNGERG